MRSFWCSQRKTSCLGLSRPVTTLTHNHQLLISILCHILPQSQPLLPKPRHTIPHNCIPSYPNSSHPPLLPPPAPHTHCPSHPPSEPQALTPIPKHVLEWLTTMGAPSLQPLKPPPPPQEGL